AEEVAQETFLRAARQGDIVSERSWLFAVATNLVRDEARKDARRRRHLELLAQEAKAVEPEVPQELKLERAEEAAAEAPAPELAPVATVDHARLLEWELQLPTVSDITAASQHAEKGGYAVRETGGEAVGAKREPPAAAALGPAGEVDRGPHDGDVFGDGWLTWRSIALRLLAALRDVGATVEHAVRAVMTPRT
ncbi:MAG: RNA polymerase sigma factor, partial [Thermoplasmatota archaeon]